jgi:Ca-activated chloride channel homolog
MTMRMVLACCVLAVSFAGCRKEPAPPASTAASNAPAPAAGSRINTGPPVDGEATIKAPASAAAGAMIEVSWTGPGNARDYVDLVPRGYVPASGELTYAYMADSVPTAKLRMPTKAGDYDVRYIVALASEHKVKAVVPLTVTDVTATLTAPAEAGAAEPMSIDWTGPDGKGDYVDVVPAGYVGTSGEITYAYTSVGKPAKVKAPGAAGNYDVRYLLEGTGGRKVLATATVKVTMPEATLNAPDAVKPGETFIVEYTGPKREGDYVDLVKKGYIATSGELTYFYANGTAPNQLKAPADAGEYDIRYILQAPNLRAVLTKRQVKVQ